MPAAPATGDRLLADAGRLLVERFDDPGVLPDLVRLLVPGFARCAAFAPMDPADLAPAWAADTPAREALLGEMMVAHRPPPDAPDPGLEPLRTGKPSLVPDVTPEVIRAVTQGRHAEILEGMAFRAFLSLPLRARGEIVGILLLYHERPDGFDPETVRLLERFADLAGRAMANARVHRALHAAHARLAAQEGRIEALLSAVPAVVWEAWGAPDASRQRIDYVSPHVERLLGYSVEEWRATPNFWLAIVHPDDRDQAARDAAEHFARGGAGINTFRWVAKDGRVLDMLSHSVVIADEQGRPLGMRGVSIDVTHQRAAERELDAARRAMAHSEKLAALGTLVSGVAHEIRTPLAYIQNHLALVQKRIEREAAAGDLAGHVAAALDGVDRVNALVRDLRRFARLPSTVASQPLEGVAREALTLFEAAHRGRVVVEARLAPTPAVRVDAGQVQQVILNLLQNAAEASPPGRAIRLETRAAPGAAEILVRDEGVGIPPDVLARMYEPFFTTKKEGTGLGLSIVRRIVEAHGATLACDTKPGRGTTFVATFPEATP